MKAFATIQEITRESDAIIAKCDDGNTYKTKDEEWYQDLVPGDWLTISDWELAM